MRFYRLKSVAAAILAALLFGIGQGSPYAGVVEDKFNELIAYAQNAVLTNKPFIPSPRAPMGTYDVDYPNVTYQEYNAIDLIEPWINNFLDAMGWWLQQRPRGDANINEISLNKYVSNSWQKLPYNVNIFNWFKANSGLTASNIPTGAKYHAGVKIGHLVGSNSYPQIADFRGNGYFRLTGLPPMGFGASNRVFGYRMFDSDEKFPETRFLYARITNAEILEFALLSESEEVIGATWFKFNFSGANGGYGIDVKSRFFARKNLPAKERGVSPLLLSTMYWTPQAHDTDTVIHLANGRVMSQKRLANPTALIVTRLGIIVPRSEVRIEQRERNPSAYGPSSETPYYLRSSFRITGIRDATRELELVVIESPTGDEFADNVVVALRVKDREIQEDQPINISYRIQPYFTLLLPSAVKNWREY